MIHFLVFNATKYEIFWTMPEPEQLECSTENSTVKIKKQENKKVQCSKT